ncbi:hypothetical protein H5079_13635 [Pseudoalteromonas sp. SG44-5]|uniref:hypothetical protein n=1 Tax=Pseudoalteromonas sp. SG44-5 TaxID=2760960 RepID=UPI0015F7EC10|nr:hypothetical protein [Pseudoalteromonas sp. SG44-5]MBB1406645.1 hypothetical protein [Pseudoalteromonas sp. SG44-5]
MVEVFKPVYIKSPTKLCIYEPKERSLTLAFLHRCDQASLNESLPILVDLSSLEYFSAAASVLLLSTIQRARYYGPHSNKHLNVTILEPQKQRVKGLLSITGLITALDGHKENDFKKLFLTGSNYLTGNTPKVDSKNLSDHICKKYKLQKLPNRLSTAIDEAMLNVLHHAYNKDTHIFMKYRWWACAQIVEDQYKNKHLQCIILDRGVGISKTIAEGYPEKINNSLDSNIIEFAMKEGVTSTRIDGRGQGFEDMKHPIKLSCEQDFMSILSHKGEVRFERNKSTPIQYPDTVSSTIVEWSLQFDE